MEVTKTLKALFWQAGSELLHSRAATVENFYPQMGLKLPPMGFYSCTKHQTAENTN